MGILNANPKYLRLIESEFFILQSAIFNEGVGNVWHRGIYRPEGDIKGSY